MKRQQLRNFCFTLNNWTDEEITTIKTIKFKYLIYGKEVGESGTPHLQGYMELAGRRDFDSIKKIIPRMHIEVRRGTAKEASDYCKKDGNFEEEGEISKQGDRKDIVAAYDAAKSGVRMEEFMDSCPSYQNLRIFEKAVSVYQKKRDFKPEVYWLYGPTGSGKTRYVVEKEKDLWISGKNLRWWDGYENQEATLFDDFRKDFCTFHELLRILDRYPMTVEVKGGHRVLNSKRMYITSCFNPEEIYHVREDIAQLLRRITEIRHVTKVDVTEVGGNTIPRLVKDWTDLIEKE